MAVKVLYCGKKPVVVIDSSAEDVEPDTETDAKA